LLSTVSEQGSHGPFLIVLYPRDYSLLTGYSKGELFKNPGFMIIDTGDAKWLRDRLELVSQCQHLPALWV